MRGRFAALVTSAAVFFTGLAADAASDGLGSKPLAVVLLLAGLSLLPFVLVTTTSFAKIVVVLSIVRTALGTPQLPPATVVTGLAIVLTGYVMAPTASAIWAEVQKNEGRSKASKKVAAEGEALALLSSGGAYSVYRAFLRAREPLRRFMLRHSHKRDRMTFRQIAGRMAKGKWRVDARDFAAVVPAFIVGQLASAFRIGFLLFVPFVVLDLVVANVLLALGMHMMSPTTLALPLKLLLFVSVDGWSLITRGLVSSYL